MNNLDWILLALLGLTALRGFRGGLLSSLAGLGGYAAGLALSLVYTRPLLDFLTARGILANLASRLQGAIPLPAPVLALPLGGLGKGGPGAVLDTLNLPVPLRALFPGSWPAASGATGAATVGQALAAWLAAQILQAASFLVIIFLTGLLARTLARTVGAGLGHGALGLFNRLGGALLATAATWLFFALLAGFTGPLLVLGGPLEGLQRSFYGSRLVPYLLSSSRVFGELWSRLI